MIYSRQREIILNTLRTNPVHPTTDELHEMVKGQDPNISIATVYRNLNQLAAAGKVFKISNPNGADRFDGNIVHHNHAVCSHCGRMFDIMVPLPDVCAAANAQRDIYVDGVSMLFSGICARCAQTQRNEYR